MAYESKGPCPNRPRKFLWFRWHAKHDIVRVGARRCTPSERGGLPSGASGYHTVILKCRSCDAQFFRPACYIPNPIFGE
jgi:hypothetical protein